MALKGITNVSRIMTQFMNENGIECQALPSTEFSYLLDKDIILYSFFALGNGVDKMFLNTFINLGLEYTCDVFLISWIHEIGHYMTIKDIDDKEYFFAEIIKEEIKTQYPSNLKEWYKINHRYWRLADEKAANEWAVDFMNNNRDKLEELWYEKLQPAIMNFYRLNGVEI